MRIATYTHRGTPSYGVVTANGIVDLGKRIGSKYPSLLALLEKGGLDEARHAAEGQKADFAESDIQYLPLIPDRINIYCTGLNYRDHIAETKSEAPTSALIMFAVAAPPGTITSSVSTSHAMSISFG